MAFDPSMPREDMSTAPVATCKPANSKTTLSDEMAAARITRTTMARAAPLCTCLNKM